MALKNKSDIRNQLDVSFVKLSIEHGKNGFSKPYLMNSGYKYKQKNSKNSNIKRVLF